MSCSQWSPPSTKHMVLQSCRAPRKYRTKHAFSRKRDVVRNVLKQNSYWKCPRSPSPKQSKIHQIHRNCQSFYGPPSRNSCRLVGSLQIYTYAARQMQIHTIHGLSALTTKCFCQHLYCTSLKSIEFWPSSICFRRHSQISFEDLWSKMCVRVPWLTACSEVWPHCLCPRQALAQGEH